LGETHAAVVEIELDSTEATALGIALDRTAELAGWDDAALAALLESLPGDLADVAGFSEAELGALLDALAPAPDIVEDEVPAPPDDPVTRPGDLIVLGEHRLLCGDSAVAADVDRLLDGAPIHLVNTDPPYNVKVEPRSDTALALGNNGMPGGGQFEKIKKGTLKAKTIRPKDRRLENDFRDDAHFEEFIGAVIGHIGRVLVEGRGFYIWCGAFPSVSGGPANTETFPRLFRDAGLRYSQMIVWNKGHGILGRKDFMTQYEVCLYGWKAGSAHEFFGPNNVTDLWDVKRVTQSQMVHLTEKPVELAARAIQYSSKKGENILDLFGGSGSTLMAAEQTGRRAYLMEIDAAYCDVIVQRWEKLTGRTAERINSE
jgi:DNA modification methylase